MRRLARWIESVPPRSAQRIAIVGLLATALSPVAQGFAQTTTGGTGLPPPVANGPTTESSTYPSCGGATGAGFPASGALYCGMLGGLPGGERAGVSASLAVSHVNTGNAFGIGTVVNGAAEQFLAGTNSGISRYGFSLAAAIATSGLLGGAGSLYLNAAWARGTLEATGDEEVGANGVGQVGLTFLYLDGILGTGVGTDFAGDAIVGEAAFSNRWSVAGFGYREALPAPVGPAGSRIDYSVGISYETLRQGGAGDARIVRGDDVLASQSLYTETIDRYFGFRVAGGFTTSLTTNLEFRLGGYVTPSIHSAWGRMEQFTDFAGGLTQILDVDDVGLGLATGLEAELGFRCCGPSGNLAIVLGGEVSLLTGVTSVRVPANPLEQPAAFEPVAMPRAFGFIGLQARF